MNKKTEREKEERERAERCCVSVLELYINGRKGEECLETKDWFDFFKVDASTLITEIRKNESIKEDFIMHCLVENKNPDALFQQEYDSVIG